MLTLSPNSPSWELLPCGLALVDAAGKVQAVNASGRASLCRLLSVAPSGTVTDVSGCVPLRDGINLSTDIYLPKTGGPFPTILIRTPYSNHTEQLIARARALAKPCRRAQLSSSSASRDFPMPASPAMTTRRGCP